MNLPLKMCYYIHYSLSTKRKKSASVLAATAIKKRTMNTSSSQRIYNLKQMQIKPNTQSNVNWAVSAYNRWRNERLEFNEYDYGIYAADINQPDKLERANLNHALCHFIPEITKVNGEAFPGKTLYQLIVSLQKFLETKKRYWRLIEDRDFRDVKTVLDNVMKERALMNLGLVSRQADLITYEMEQNLWSKHLLGDDTPDKLRTTCYFYLGLRFCLRSVQDHYGLRRDVPGNKGQLSFKTVQGKNVLVYMEDAVTKTHDGGLKDRKRDRKKGALFESDNPDRDPVRFVRKYLSLCPPSMGSQISTCNPCANLVLISGIAIKLLASRVSVKSYQNSWRQGGTKDTSLVIVCVGRGGVGSFRQVSNANW